MFARSKPITTLFLFVSLFFVGEFAKAEMLHNQTDVAYRLFILLPKDERSPTDTTYFMDNYGSITARHSDVYAQSSKGSWSPAQLYQWNLLKAQYGEPATFQQMYAYAATIEQENTDGTTAFSQCQTLYNAGSYDAAWDKCVTATINLENVISHAQALRNLDTCTSNMEALQAL